MSTTIEQIVESPAVGVTVSNPSPRWSAQQIDAARPLLGFRVGTPRQVVERCLSERNCSLRRIRSLVDLSYPQIEAERGRTEANMLRVYGSEVAK
jgi:hypothetical protein